jgi:hypothetical protein
MMVGNRVSGEERRKQVAGRPEQFRKRPTSPPEDFGRNLRFVAKV